MITFVTAVDLCTLVQLAVFEQSALIARMHALLLFTVQGAMFAKGGHLARTCLCS